MPSEASGRIRRALGSPRTLIAALSLLTVVQTGLLLKSYVVPWGEAIYGVRGVPAWQRSGLLTPWIGADAVRYFAFLREATVEDGTLVFLQDDFLYGSRPMLQYFLFPREIVVCRPSESSSCLAGVSGEPAYVAVIGGYPDPAALPFQATFQAFDGRRDLGVFVPVDFPADAEERGR